MLSHTPALRSRKPAITARQITQQSPTSRSLTTLRLTPQSRTRLANASFLSAFLFSIFTVSYLSGQSPGRLPCPARPNGTGQRADADVVDGNELVYIEPPAPRSTRQAVASPPTDAALEASQLKSSTEQEPRFNSMSARLAYQVSKWRQGSG